MMFEPWADNMAILADMLASSFSGSSLRDSAGERIVTTRTRRW